MRSLRGQEAGVTEFVLMLIQWRAGDGGTAGELIFDPLLKPVARQKKYTKLHWGGRIRILSLYYVEAVLKS